MNDKLTFEVVTSRPYEILPGRVNYAASRIDAASMLWANAGTVPKMIVAKNAILTLLRPGLEDVWRFQRRDILSFGLESDRTLLLANMFWDAVRREAKWANRTLVWTGPSVNPPSNPDVITNCQILIASDRCFDGFNLMLDLVKRP